MFYILELANQVFALLQINLNAVHNTLRHKALRIVQFFFKGFDSLIHRFECLARRINSSQQLFQHFSSNIAIIGHRNCHWERFFVVANN